MCSTVVALSVFLVFMLPAKIGSIEVKENEKVDRIKVQVYYETLCPDSRDFFRYRLKPSMRGKNRLQYTDLELIPFGKAFVYNDPATKQLLAECQHGENECVGNALHACILETTESEKAFDVITCLMSTSKATIQRCASDNNLDLDPVNNCVANRTTAEILQPYGEATKKIDLTFVPSIALNERFDYSEQNRLLYQFDSMFCRKYRAKFDVQLQNCP